MKIVVEGGTVVGGGAVVVVDGGGAAVVVTGAAVLVGGGGGAAVVVVVAVRSGDAGRGTAMVVDVVVSDENANAAGSIIEMRGLPGLAAPRYAAACPLWALYRAQQTPGAVVRQRAVFPNGGRFVFADDDRTIREVRQAYRRGHSRFHAVLHVA